MNRVRCAQGTQKASAQQLEVSQIPRGKLRDIKFAAQPNIRASMAAWGIALREQRVQTQHVVKK